MFQRDNSLQVLDTVRELCDIYLFINSSEILKSEILSVQRENEYLV